jgi:hypothetical protein
MHFVIFFEFRRANENVRLCCQAAAAIEIFARNFDSAGNKERRCRP